MFWSGISTNTSIGKFGSGQQQYTEFWEMENTLYDTRSRLAIQLSADFNVADSNCIYGMVIGYPDMLWVIKFLVGCIIGPIMAHMCRGSRVDYEVGEVIGSVRVLGYKSILISMEDICVGRRR